MSLTGARDDDLIGVVLSVGPPDLFQTIFWYFLFPRIAERLLDVPYPVNGLITFDVAVPEDMDDGIQRSDLSVKSAVAGDKR